MSTRIFDGAPLDDGHGRPTDVTTLRESDLLFDRLGRGEDPADGDAVASTLARWRATLPDDDLSDPADDELLAAALDVLRPPRRIGSVVRRSVALSVAVVLVFVSAAAATERAGPSSPLWPLTQLLFHSRAEAREATDAADDSVSAARAAIDDGRYDKASRLLDDAAASVERIGEGTEADRLSGEIASLRALIPAETDGTIADPQVRVPSSDVPHPDVPHPVVPTSPGDSPARAPDPSSVGRIAVPPVPSAGSAAVEVPPPLVSIVPLPSTLNPLIVDRPIGLVY